MGNQNEELDFELDETLDGEQEDNQDTNEYEDNSNDLWGDEETPKKKNPSNWKKMSQKLKELEAENKKLKQTTSSNIDELRLFFLENPEAKQYKDKIIELAGQDKYKSLDYDELLDLAKLRTPQPSQDSEDFSLKSTTWKTKKRLEDLTEEEALKLPNDKYLEWRDIWKTTKIGANIWG